jgi:hypothetical protein
MDAAVMMEDKIVAVGHSVEAGVANRSNVCIIDLVGGIGCSERTGTALT